MKFEKLKSKVEKAIALFFKHDYFLIKNNVNERSVTHKLAEYLQLEFSEYHVDCEYNRMVDKMIDRTMNEEKKDKDYIQKMLNLKIKEDINADDTKAKTVYPDIIIHNREKSENNLLVIEVKKETNKNTKDIDFDIEKIKAYIKQLEYKNGLFIKIGNNYDSTIKNSIWYDETGKERKKINNDQLK